MHCQLYSLGCRVRVEVHGSVQGLGFRVVVRSHASNPKPKSKAL